MMAVEKTWKATSCGQPDGGQKIGVFFALVVPSGTCCKLGILVYYSILSQWFVSRRWRYWLGTISGERVPRVSNEGPSKWRRSPFYNCKSILSLPIPSSEPWSCGLFLSLPFLHNTFIRSVPKKVGLPLCIIYLLFTRKLYSRSSLRVTSLNGNPFPVKVRRLSRICAIGDSAIAVAYLTWPNIKQWNVNWLGSGRCRATQRRVPKCHKL